MRLLGLVIALTACGSVSTKTPDASVHDAPNPDVATGSGDAPQAACDVTKPFGTITNLAGVNSNSVDEWGWLSADQLMVYFTSAATNSSDLNLYQATRATTTAAFSTPQLMGAINTTNSEERPVVTADGLTLFAQSNASGSTHIYVAARTSPAAQFGSLTMAGGVNDTTTNVIDADPWISGDGLTMYLASTRNGTYDIFRTTRASTTATFDTPTAVAELNGGSIEDAPVVSADGLEIFFASNRAANSNGRNDIWHATRASTADGFGMATEVTELSGTATEDFPTWISPDRCMLLFTSDRTGGNGSYDIWVATRPQ
jgi:Tol biopolymer transport system component